MTVLREVAQRLTACVRKADTLARAGADEFALVACDLKDDADCRVVADKLLQALAPEFRAGGRRLKLAVSVGISLFPSDGGDGEALLRNADAAMVRAKQVGRNQDSLFSDDEARALPVAVPDAHCSGAARAPGHLGLRAGARPRPAARRRPRLRQRRPAAPRPGARGDDRGGRGVRGCAPGCASIHDEHRRARVTDLRRAVFDHILGLEPAFFEKERTGEVVSRLTNDATLLQQVIGYGLSMFVRNGLMMIGAAAMLFVTSWKLALLVLVGAPATLLPILLLGRRVRRLSRASQDRVADVSATSTRRSTKSARCRPMRTRTRIARASRATPRRRTRPASSASRTRRS